MTEQQAGPKWVAQASLEHWNWEVREGERCVVFWVSEPDAKRIVADHNALQVAAEALEAIKKEGRVCDDFLMCGHPACASSSGSCLIAMDALDQIAALQSIKEQGR